MQDNWFWRGVAVIGLLVALGYVVSRFTQTAPVHAQGGSTMAVCGNENNTHQLYIVDASRKVILVYGAGASNYTFSLLAARYYDVDAQATVGKEFRYNQRGYSIKTMQAQAQR